MSDNKEYKLTLNLPKTDFPMKASLALREPETLKSWENEDIYGLIMAKDQPGAHYILHDGPPYANGNIHIGHALNKILKDIIIKYKSLRGFSCAYVPGWDCHGLPIEHQLLRELKIHKSQIGQLEFRKKAAAYANNFVATQKEQFKRLGVFADWANPYLTLSYDYEESILNAFAQLVDEGYIYRGLKPVNWCMRCETALAEAEVEYENHSSPSIYVKFKLDPVAKFPADTFLVIWTTTPWTLIANVAVAVHPSLTYCCINSEKGNFIVAKSLLDNFISSTGISNKKIISEFSGKDLEGLTYAHPFGIRAGCVVLADYVSQEEGTGLVHTAPGHGSDDYLTGIKYKLEIVMPVDAKGCYDATAGEFKGMNIFDANRPILEKLKNLGALLFESKIQHSYPHCWRCKQPVIFRATKQWFFNLDHKNLREQLIKVIENDVTWVPAAGRERITAMVQLRPHWCLSRQRYWGVPIPALICNDCKEEFISSDVARNFAGFVAKEGTDCWFERDVKDFSGEVKCPHCKGGNFTKGSDILDVWFDSGVSSQAVLKLRPALNFPAELYLEGSDQHRGWFQSSIIPAMAIDGKAPFKSVLTHGFVVDGEGRKMSKSLGNVISPFDIIKDYGADILRMWVASSDYNEDIRISPVILSRLSEAYRKIRNTARFILSNLFDFNPATDKVAYENLRSIDQWILWRSQRLLENVDKAYASFQFHNAYKEIYNFCNEDLSMYYLDMVKGRLYTFAKSSIGRRGAQTAIYEVLQILTRVVSPILSFTAEEIWRYIPREEGMPLSVHLSSWPQINRQFNQSSVSAVNNIGAKLEPILGLIPEAGKTLEEMRNAGLIGSSFDAQINMLTNNSVRYTFLQSLQVDLCEIFKVSRVEVTNNPGGKLEFELKISKAQGAKCVRCWNYSDSVGKDKQHPLICDSCLRAIGGE
ncbi:MAG: isoleucine--tRNA ligase [Candidatus Omnitrophica bacterium]|jgi:isoleucyl-tRNA synthetase|nr:isoleucine--tRNA ligase [Candidatus Omnitrophota bacterium]